MTTVHIQNIVQDFDTWKANFDKYERFRAEQGVQSYRVSRSLTEPNEVLIDLEFRDETAARAFLPKLGQIMNSRFTAPLTAARRSDCTTPARRRGRARYWCMAGRP